MKIAININALESAHRDRGIGAYTSLLVQSLTAYDKKHSYVQFNSTLSNSEKVDIVHYTYFDLFQKTLTLYKGTKTIVTVHDLIPIKFPKYFPRGIRNSLNWLLQKNNLKKADAVITDSNVSANDISELTHMPKEKIHVVYLAVSPVFKSHVSNTPLPINREHSIPDNFLLYVGDVNWNKNVPGLIRAFSILKKKEKFREFSLVLVGRAFQNKTIDEVKQIHGLIHSEKLDRSIVMPGFISESDLASLYNRARLYVQPSFYEGFGLPVLEALTCGCPVASSHSGSLPEIVGDAGKYFNPSSTTDMIRVIEEMLSMENSEKEQLKTIAKKQTGKFSLKMLAENTVDVYEKVFQSSYK